MNVPLLDLHDLGRQQTGNEVWARCIAAALLEGRGQGSYDIAVTTSAQASDLARLPARNKAVVSTSSVRRLAFDLPRALRRLASSAVLVQYTAPLSRVPAVVAVHDLSFEDPAARDWLSPGERLRYRVTIRASVRRAARLLALSDSTRADLVRYYGIDPTIITVAPAAVDPNLATLLAGPAERRTALSTGTATVLSVGNVLPRKNLATVARAVRLMRERGVDARLRLVGRVPATGAAVASEIAASLGDNVEITGYLADGELAEAYRTADVLAFPSLYEGFGIPVVEAMTAGTPVVVSDRTSLPEVVGPAGLVVPAHDVGAWADALMSAIDPARSFELSAAGRERARSYSWSRSAAVVAAALDDARLRGTG